jgi:DNA-binding FadR family transcriptional regulator
MSGVIDMMLFPEIAEACGNQMQMAALNQSRHPLYR